MFTAVTCRDSSNFKNAIQSNLENFNPGRCGNLGYGLEDTPATPHNYIKFDQFTKEEQVHIQNVLGGIHSRIEEK